MNSQQMTNFLFVCTLFALGIFGYFYLGGGWNTAQYVDLSDKVLEQKMIDDLGAYIQNNNISHLKISGNNLSLETLASMPINNKKNLTIEIVDVPDFAGIISQYEQYQQQLNTGSLDTLKKTHLSLLLEYKQIYIGPNSSITKNLSISGSNVIIKNPGTLQDRDVFDLLFTLRQKKVQSLELVGFQSLPHFEMWLKVILSEDLGIQELIISDQLTYSDQWHIFLHTYALNQNKKIFFSNKEFLKKLRALKEIPSKLNFDSIGYLDLRDILDLHTLFKNHKFELVSMRNNGINTETFKVLMEYLHFKRADIRGNEIIIGQDLCKKDLVLLTGTNHRETACSFSDYWYKRSLLYKDLYIAQTLFLVKAMFDFGVENNSPSLEIFSKDFYENENFEKFWLYVNTQKNQENIKILMDTLNRVKEKPISNKKYLYTIVRSYGEEKDFQELYGVYKKSQYYSHCDLLEQHFGIHLDKQSYFDYLAGRPTYMSSYNFSYLDNVNLKQVIDYRNQSGALIFYFNKNEQ